MAIEKKVATVRAMLPKPREGHTHAIAAHAALDAIVAEHEKLVRRLVAMDGLHKERERTG